MARCNINIHKLIALVNVNDNQLEIIMEKDSIHNIITYYKVNYNLKVQHVCE